MSRYSLEERIEHLEKRVSNIEKLLKAVVYSLHYTITWMGKVSYHLSLALFSLGLSNEKFEEHMTKSADSTEEFKALMETVNRFEE
jgi:uncharacterized coiled-coil protein SlyX